MNTVEYLSKRKLITPPEYVINSYHYEVITGSMSYGVSSDNSDVDIVGFCIPPKEVIFPHLAGEIPGFGRQHQRFDQFQQHHIIDQSNGTNYDITVYNIVKYFQLCMDNNPNMVDTLFVPDRCVRVASDIGKMVRENRKLFLHKGAYHKFKGYAYSQLHKMHTKNPEGKRKEVIEQYGFDLKFAYHLVRLLGEVEQILTEGDLDLERNREQLKAIRRGEVDKESIEDFFYLKEKYLEELYATSSLPYSPDEQAIKQLLLNCLEQAWGDLSFIPKAVDYGDILNDLKQVIKKYAV